VFEGSYATQDGEYNDHRLAETLHVTGVAPHLYAPEPVAIERSAMLQIGPQDALQLTLAEGETYMARPVDSGNINISLVWDVPEDHPELKNVHAPAWHVIYYREDIQLHFLVDAQTGATLKSYEGLW